MFDNVSEKLRGRALRIAQKEATADLIKLAVPGITALSRCGDLLFQASRKSDDRFEKFAAEFPFYGFTRRAPSIAALVVVYRAMQHYSQDYDLRQAGLLPIFERREGGAAYWQDVIESKPRVATETDYTIEERQAADNAYRAMQPELAKDILPALPEIERFSRITKDIRAKEKAHLATHKDLELSLRGYGLSLEGQAQTLMRVLIGYPGMKPILQEQKNLDYVYWGRLGQDVDPARQLSPEQQREMLSSLERIRALERALFKGN